MKTKKVNGKGQGVGVLALSYHGERDAFGGLTISCVHVTSKAAKIIGDAWIKYNQTLTGDNSIALLKLIDKHCNFLSVHITPEAYNDSCETLNDQKTLIKKGYTSVLLEFNNDHPTIVYHMTLCETVKKQRDTKMPAALLIARLVAEMTYSHERYHLSKLYDIDLRNSYADPLICAGEFVLKYGKDQLCKVAKLHLI